MITVTRNTTLSDSFAHRLDTLVEGHIPSRIASQDATIWGPEATHEASIRLGWTADPAAMRDLIYDVDELRTSLAAEGIHQVVLCGMGGSSLAPEVIATRHGHSLTILDSTHPDQVSAALGRDLADTVVVVASKSGTTVETAAARAAFEDAFVAAGLPVTRHMVFVTDPDSPLDQEARAAGYRVFAADPTVGGRFSALTAFGLVPTTLAGADTKTVIDQAAGVVSVCGSDGSDNPAAVLAAALADPATPFAVIVPDGTSLPGLGDWIEQLVAESTGKEGKGVLPIVVDGVDHPTVTSPPADVLLIGVTSGHEPVPGVHLTIHGSLGEQFVVWQWATAMAGFLLEINPFDQPDVESAKAAARSLLEERPEPADTLLHEAGIDVSALHLHPDLDGGIAGVWRAVIDRVGSDGYIALHIYADREAEGDWLHLSRLLADVSGRPVTIGFGPRFLHSTGQFHKGGTPSGTFVQIEVPSPQALPIPGFPFDFGQLIDAQAAGDRQVLASRGLAVVTFRASDPGSLPVLASGLESGEH